MADETTRMPNRETRTAGMRVAVLAVTAGAAITLGLPAQQPRAAADPSYPSDAYGYLDSDARCDDGQTMLMFGRTERALVAICVGPDGQLEYRGVRLSDQAGLTLGAGRSAGGAIVAENDDVSYSITPTALTVSEGDAVLYRDAWLEFHQAGPSGPPATTSSSAATSSSSPATAPTSAGASPTTTSPTVSTTTVTLAPKSAGTG